MYRYVYCKSSVQNLAIFYTIGKPQHTFPFKISNNLNYGKKSLTLYHTVPTFEDPGEGGF